MDGTMDLRLEKLRAMGADSPRGMGHRVERIMGALTHADDALDILAQRLQPVLTAERVEPTLGSEPSPEPASQLSAHLSDLEDRLRSLGQRLERLAQRVDL